MSLSKKFSYLITLEKLGSSYFKNDILPNRQHYVSILCYISEWLQQKNGLHSKYSETSVLTNSAA